MKKFDCLKIFTIFFIITSTVSAFTTWEVEERDKISKECREQSGASSDDIFNIRRGRLDNTPEVKKQLVCYQRKRGMINQQGQIVLEAVRNKIRRHTEDEFVVDNIVNKCITHAKDTTDETLFKALKCMIKETRKLTMADHTLIP